MVYVVLDLEPRASSMLDEHSPADAGAGGGLLLFGSVGDGTPGPLLLCTHPHWQALGSSSPTEPYPQPFVNLGQHLSCLGCISRCQRYSFVVSPSETEGLSISLPGYCCVTPLLRPYL